MAVAARLQAKVNDQFQEIISKNLEAPDALLAFPATKAQNWRLHLRAGMTGAVVLRGLRFFHGEDEIFPRLVP